MTKQSISLSYSIMNAVKWWFNFFKLTVKLILCIWRMTKKAKRVANKVQVRVMLSIKQTVRAISVMLIPLVVAHAAQELVVQKMNEMNKIFMTNSSTCIGTAIIGVYNWFTQYSNKSGIDSSLTW